MNEIEKELAESVGLEIAQDKDNNYRAKLMRSVINLSDEKWETISDEAKDWVNLSVKAFNEGEELPLFPGEEVEVEEEEVEDNKVDDEQETTDNTKRFPPTPTSLKRKMKGRGAGWRMKELMLKHGLDVKPAILFHLLSDEGYILSVGTIESIRAEFRQTMKVLAAEDRLK
jgi:hypothetical protein